MSRVKVKSVKKTLGNKDVQELFRSALGGGDAPLDYTITWPKFKRVRSQLARFVKAVAWLQEQHWLQDMFPAEQQKIREYAATLGREFMAGFKAVPDLDAHADDIKRQTAQAAGGDALLDLCPVFDDVPAAVLEEFAEKYRAAMESDLVNTAVVTCKNLSTHKAQLEEREKLSGHFLRKAGLEYAPLPDLPSANFKAFYQAAESLPDGRHVQTAVLMFLHKLYAVTHDVYEATSLPDINVDDFVEIIIGSLDDVKKYIPRCDDAFRALGRSVALLKSNFSAYYRDMKNSGNASIMMENFVLDVANQTEGTSPSVKRQFRQIISYYRKMAQQQPKNSQTQALFSELDANLAALDRRDREAGVEEDADEPPEEAEAEEAEGETDAAVPTVPAPATPEEKERTRRERKARARRKKGVAQSIDRALGQEFDQAALGRLDAAYEPSDLGREIDARRKSAAGGASRASEAAADAAGEASAATDAAGEASAAAADAAGEASAAE